MEHGNIARIINCNTLLTAGDLMRKTDFLILPI